MELVIIKAKVIRCKSKNEVFPYKALKSSLELKLGQSIHTQLPCAKTI